MYYFLLQLIYITHMCVVFLSYIEYQRTGRIVHRCILMCMVTKNKNQNYIEPSKKDFMRSLKIAAKKRAKR